MPPPNLLLILIDDVRADRVLHPGARAATPFLGGLAARGVVHEAARSVCGWTLPACASIVTGRMPSDHSLIHHEHRFARPKIPALLGPGWATFGVGNNGNLVPDDISDAELAAMGFERRPEVWKRFGWQDGFETYRWFHKEDGASPFRVFSEWIAARAADPRPWFAMLHSNVVHDYDHDDDFRLAVDRWLGRPLHSSLRKFRDGPWTWKDPPGGLTQAQIDEELSAKYDAGIEEMDRRLAAAMAGVDLATTLVVFVSDHGEGFDGAAERVHHCGRLHDDLLRVPLVVVYPPGTPGAPPPGSRDARPASVLDVAATMLAVAGRPDPSLPGCDLRALPESRTLAAEDFGYLYAPPSAVAEPFRRYEYKTHDIALRAETMIGPGSARKRIDARIGRQSWTEEYDLVADPAERINRAKGPQGLARKPERGEGAVAAAFRAWREGDEGPPTFAERSDWNAFVRRHDDERRLPTSEAPGASLPPVTFIVAVDDPVELRRHVLASRVWLTGSHEWFFVENRRNRAYSSISRLYSDAARRASHGLLCYVHQDVFFLPDWESRATASLAALAATDPDWGVVGVAGRAPELPDGSEPANIGHWSDPHKYHKPKVPLPAEVQVLDELLLLVRRDAGLSFDPEMPGFHCYGADLCMAARDRGMRSWVIDAPVVHKLFLPDGRIVARADHSHKIEARRTDAFRADFNRSADHVRRKWARHLPFRGTAHFFGR